jgi:uncharacterized protein (UPF0305 family)
MVLSEGNTEKKSPVTPPGIFPGTVRLVAQGLNHYANPERYRFHFVISSVSSIVENISEQSCRLKYDLHNVTHLSAVCRDISDQFYGVYKQRNVLSEET